MLTGESRDDSSWGRRAAPFARLESASCSRVGGAVPPETAFRGSGVGRKDPEWAAAYRYRAEVPLIEREDVCHAVALRKNDDRRVSETDPKVGVALDDVPRPPDVGTRYWRQRVGAVLDLRKHPHARRPPTRVASR